MKTLKLLLAGVLLMITGVQAQVIDYNKQPGPEEDGVFIKHHVFENRVVPYVHIREADVMWTRKYWRKIDVREKKNHALYYPITEIKDRKCLADVLWSAAKDEGTITAYSDEEFTQVKTPQEVANMLFKVDSVIDNDPVTGLPFSRVDTIRVTPSQVILWLIKEAVVFDKKRGMMETRILGLCPVVMKEDETGQQFPEEVFWIWYPEARQVLANAEVFNPKNSAERRSFEEIFQKRQFASYIYKEENDYDRSISEYKRNSPMDQLLEADRLKEEVRIFESDLWEY